MNGTHSEQFFGQWRPQETNCCESHRTFFQRDWNGNKKKFFCEKMFPSYGKKNLLLRGIQR